MNSSVEDRGSYSVVHLHGRITIESDMVRLETLFDHAGVPEGKPVVVDLSGVNFIDSAGLGELVALNRRAVAAGGKLVLAAARGKVKDLLELTQIGQLIPLAPTMIEGEEILTRRA